MYLYIKNLFGKYYHFCTEVSGKNCSQTIWFFPIYLFFYSIQSLQRDISYLPLNLKNKHFFYLPSKIDRQIIFFKLSHFLQFAQAYFFYLFSQSVLQDITMNWEARTLNSFSPKRMIYEITGVAGGQTFYLRAKFT